ncbi:hypothetical protein F4779DRAFT_623793 [Xylariaceae sp. FL0662B]|nr:hypothetical protein F4779DRAFT_623793 [Xylariaceae sp. FL0662B]
MAMQGHEEDIDGDIHRLRIKQIRSFILDLSPSPQEVRYLKNLLSGFKVDIIGELPVEIVRQIAELLELRHYVTCLAVSKSWRNKFLSEPVIGAMVNRYCPFLDQSSDRAKGTQDDRLKELRRIGCANWGKPVWVRDYFWVDEQPHFNVEEEYHGNDEDIGSLFSQSAGEEIYDGPDGSDALYSCSKIAWCPKDRVVEVMSLWSRRAKFFTTPNGPIAGPRLKLLALGNTLVVGAISHLLVAWNHVTNAYQEKRLPGSVQRCATEGSKVAIVLFSGDIFLWEFGNKLLALPVDHLIRHHTPNDEVMQAWRSNLRIVFQPGCDSTIFLATGYTAYVNSKAVLRRTVYEFKNTDYLQRFDIEFPSETSFKAYDRETSGNCVRIRQLMKYGRFTIGFFEAAEHDHPGFIGPPRAEYSFVEFDIYERKFTSREWSGCPCNFFEPSFQRDLDFQLKFHAQHFRVVGFQPEYQSIAPPSRGILAET